MIKNQLPNWLFWFLLFTIQKEKRPGCLFCYWNKNKNCILYLTISHRLMQWKKSMSCIYVHKKTALKCQNYLVAPLSEKTCPIRAWLIENKSFYFFSPFIAFCFDDFFVWTSGSSYCHHPVLCRVSQNSSVLAKYFLLAKSTSIGAECSENKKRGNFSKLGQKSSNFDFQRPNISYWPNLHPWTMSDIVKYRGSEL